jgi:hypothetical protein
MVEIAQKQKDLALRAKEIPNKRIWRIFPQVHQKEWMVQAMWNILHNKGAYTAGIDGVVKADYYDAKTNELTPRAKRRIDEICQ